MIRVNFGAGHCRIDGWQNTDFDYPEGPDRIDITKPLPFGDNSVDRILSEMCCEHVTHQQAWSFLVECHRILKPGGLIRITIPDFSLCWRLKDPDWLRVNQGVTNNDGSLRDQMKSIIFAHGHQGLWNSDLLLCVMEAIGFMDCSVHRAGESKWDEFKNIEQHHHSVGLKVALAESGCVEGCK